MSSGFINGITEIKGESLIRAGTAVIGDIGAAAGAQAVTGYFSSANKVNPSGSSSRLSVVYPDLGFIPVVIVTINSIGTESLDNDVTLPIIRNITSTGFDVFFEETASVLQNIILMAILVSQQT